MILAQEGGAAALSATGSTGNKTGAAVAVANGGPVTALQFVVEVIGATPTVTFKYQGSLDGTNWFDVSYITDASSTEAVTTKVVTTVSSTVLFVANSSRAWRYYRVVVTANTNVTYRAELYTGGGAA